MTKQTEALKIALEAMEQARGALAYVAVGNAETNPNLARSTCRHGIHAIDKVEPALREALAEQPAPITWTPEDGLRPQDIRVELYPPQPTSGMVFGMSKGVRLVHAPTGTIVECDTERSHHRNREVALKKLEAALAEQPAPEDSSVVQPAQQQEPVGRECNWCDHKADCEEAGTCVVLLQQDKTAPPAQRKPLTDEQIQNMYVSCKYGSVKELARAIEAAHGIKENT